MRMTNKYSDWNMKKTSRFALGTDKDEDYIQDLEGVHDLTSITTTIEMLNLFNKRLYELKRENFELKSLLLKKEGNND